MKKALWFPAALGLAISPAYAQSSSTTTTTKTETRQGTSNTGSSTSGTDRNTSTSSGGSSGTMGAGSQGSGSMGPAGAGSPNRDTMSGQSSERSDRDRDHDRDDMAGEKDMKPTTSAQVLQHLHRTNQMEIDMGKLAKDNGQSQQVKDYGDKLVKDHTKADDRVKDFAKKMNADLDAKDDALAKHDLAKAAHTKDRMKDVKGQEFDRMFLHHMVEDHRKDIHTVQTAMTEHADLKPVLSEILPDLQAHQKQAEMLLQNMGKGQKSKNMGRSSSSSDTK